MPIFIFFINVLLFACTLTIWSAEAARKSKAEIEADLGRYLPGDASYDYVSSGALRRGLNDILDSVHVLGQTTRCVVTDNAIPPGEDVMDIGACGSMIGVWAPTANSDAVVSPTVWGLEVDTSAGSVGGPSGLGHAAILQFLSFDGGGSVAQGFFEKRIRVKGNTTVGPVWSDKIVVENATTDGNSGSVIVGGMDFPDLSSATEYPHVAAVLPAVRIQDTRATIDTVAPILAKGGIRTGRVAIGTPTYAVTSADCGKAIATAAGTPVTVTLPDTMPAGCEIGFAPLDANQISFAGGGTALVLNASGHARTRTLYSVVNARTFTDGVWLLSGDTAP